MKILSVVEKSNHRGPWWLIKTDQDGARKLATSNMFDAALAKRAEESGGDVTVRTRSGWHYDDLTFIRFTETP